MIRVRTGAAARVHQSRKPCGNGSVGSRWYWAVPVTQVHGQPCVLVADALAANTVPCPVIFFEVPDRGAPADRERFWALATDVAKRLQSGDVVLIHCAGGVGRTALLAVCVLLALGEPANAARSAVSRAGSTVETAPQSQLISWCAAKAKKSSE